MGMASLSDFLRQNEPTMSLVRWVIFPLCIAATFFLLDGRYVRKADVQTSFADQKQSIEQLSIEQKMGFTNLTNAISALTTEQRNQAEAQHANAAAFSSLLTRFDKHDFDDAARWNELNNDQKTQDSRLNNIEVLTARHDVEITQIITNRPTPK
jgi:uncharacterized membrane protein YdfJ with MMPL/SSD domain